MGTCNICGSERPKGYTVTCGRSLCQEAEYFANAARTARKGSRRQQLLTREAQEKAERATRFAHSSRLQFVAGTNGREVLR